MRKLLSIDVKKAHLIPRVEGDVYIQLPEEARAAPGCAANSGIPCMEPEMLHTQQLLDIGFEHGLKM